MMVTEYEKITDLIEKNGEKIRKIVFSKAHDPKIVRVSVKPIRTGDESCFQAETLTVDQKAFHRNLSLQEAPKVLSEWAVKDFGQTNILFTEGEIQVKVSSKGKISVIGSVGKNAVSATPEAHNREKNYLISAEKYPEFLSALGVCDEKGRVFDKKRSKYRQINRFVELLDDVYDRLPAEGQLTVCDLCCGKSYLTFAVWFYLTAVKERQVEMYGVDLKADVIDYCSRVAERLGCHGIHFLCQDIMTFDPGVSVDLVISLHACDIATDVVLAYAIQKRAKLILSTPCCHHETFHQLGQNPLHAVMKYSILKQKFADALTDALRALFLESKGYHVEALELIDPEETPKNVMIRAVYAGRINLFAAREYESTVREFGLDPTLARLVDGNARKENTGADAAPKQ